MEILFTFYPSDPISKVVKRNKQFFEVWMLVNINVTISFKKMEILFYWNILNVQFIKLFLIG